MQPIYLHAIAAVCAQDICNESKSLQKKLPKELKLTAVEPEYFKLINPVKLRRMSRIHKMSLYAAINCINNLVPQKDVDGVIIGTAKGSMLDTEKFIKDLDYYKEESMNPTPFIASTYNAVNGAIALTTQTTVYHQTYVNRGSSFENALLDAQMLCAESSDNIFVLVGGFEELTEEYYALKNKLNYWKKSSCSDKGTIPGEGACFAIISKNYISNSLAINSIISSFNFESINNNDSTLFYEMLAKSNINLKHIKLFVFGFNDNSNDDGNYLNLLENVPKDVGVIKFKNLFGEFETVGSFALWLLWAIKNQYNLPEDIWIQKPQTPLLAEDAFVIFNHYYNENYNIIAGRFT